MQFCTVLFLCHERRQQCALKSEATPPKSQGTSMSPKKSRPVITPHGKVVEEIEPGAFQAAIDRGGNISLTLDHDKSHVYASTSDGSLELYEDDIGLHASVLVKDRNVIELAKQGKIRGWSFRMYNVQDELEHRADDLPLRKIKALDGL